MAHLGLPPAEMTSKLRLDMQRHDLMIYGWDSYHCSKSKAQVMEPLLYTLELVRLESLHDHIQA